MPTLSMKKVFSPSTGFLGTWSVFDVKVPVKIKMIKIINVIKMIKKLRDKDDKNKQKET